MPWDVALFEGQVKSSEATKPSKLPPCVPRPPSLREECKLMTSENDCRKKQTPPLPEGTRRDHDRLGSLDDARAVEHDWREGFTIVLVKYPHPAHSYATSPGSLAIAGIVATSFSAPPHRGHRRLSPALHPLNIRRPLEVWRQRSSFSASPASCPAAEHRSGKLRLRVDQHHTSGWQLRCDGRHTRWVFPSECSGTMPRPRSASVPQVEIGLGTGEHPAKWMTQKRD